MKNVAMLFVAVVASLTSRAQDFFPDGTLVPDWFREAKNVNADELGKHYVLTDYGVQNDSTAVQTSAIQAVIDLAASGGGGVICVPAGTFLSGSLFFRAGTHLHLDEGATLKGSDDISHFAVIPTRIEGLSRLYFAALVNAIGCDGFTISGRGTIDGNGLRYWKSFWLRRAINPDCTNIEEMRPRLVYIAGSTDVTIEGVRLQNSPFWTTHLYKCSRVTLQDLHISSPAEPVKAPSTDAIDIDACTSVHVRRCYMSVNDDAIALKGGKGPYADADENNGGNENIIIEDCVYGFCHGALTFGSESILDRNIILRRIKIDQAQRLLWLKMRPDTPQLYEHILVEDITGNATHFLYIKPWKQFFDLQGRTDIPRSRARHITMRRIDFRCTNFLSVEESAEQYDLENIVLSDINVQTSDPSAGISTSSGITLRNVSTK